MANTFNQQLITQNNVLLFSNNVLDNALSASQWVAVWSFAVENMYVKMYSMLIRLCSLSPQSILRNAMLSRYSRHFVNKYTVVDVGSDDDIKAIS